MKLLALDCSTEACSVALYENDSAADAGSGRVLEEVFQLASRQHTQRLLPMVEQVLASGGSRLSQLDYIAFGRGPGSFTGLRIALGAVQGLAFGAELPVVAVSSLAGLAQSAVDLHAGDRTCDRVFAAMDARMGEVYWARYQVREGLVDLEGEERLTDPGEMMAQLAQEPMTVMPVGSGWHCAREHEELLSAFDLVTQCHPGAGAIARLADREARQGRSCSAEAALPVYLRDEVAWQKTGAV